MQHPVQARWPDVAGRIQNAPARTSVVMQFEPANRVADDQLDMGASFVKQRRGLDGALTAANHSDPHPLEPAEVTVRPGVRCERRRKLAGEGGQIRESIDANRDDHSRRAQRPPVIEFDRKVGAIRRQRFDQRGIDVWHGMPLEPQSVIHEEAQGDRLLLLPAGGPEEAVKVTRPVGCRQAGSAPRRSEVHAGGHPLPERHGLAECLRRQARAQQMGCDRQRIGGGANDHGGLHVSRPSAYGRNHRGSYGHQRPWVAPGVPAPARESRVWEKRLLTPGPASALTVLMPVAGAVHPDVFARWTRSPLPVDSGASPPARRGDAVIELERVIEPEPGGNTVTQTTQLARVLIADDQTLFRSGLAGLLNQDRRVSGVGQAGDGDDAGKQAGTLKPDVVLMDVKMPNLDGVEATRRIVAEHPEIKILILTTFDADTFMLPALRAGASGYVLKDSQPQAIVSSILAVRSGERVIASAVANRVLDMLTGTTTAKDFYDGLTVREIEILKLMAMGQANKQIARRLEISEKTVRNHVSHMYEKLHIYERSQAVLYAVRKGLVEL